MQNALEPMTKTRRLRWLISLALVLAIAAIAAVVARPRGVEATVRNNGTTAMRDVRVTVTGRSYSLGDVPPRESRSVRVNPTGESRIVLAYADANGTSQSLNVNCYFESGYAGHIKIDVVDGVVTNVDDQIRVARK